MKTILSCTTTAGRLKIFYYCYQSLLKQSFKPNLFIVNIANEEFGEEGDFNIPDWLNKDDITLNLVPDIGPYKKLIPTLEFANDEDLIITSDDDVIYSENWLHDLVEKAKLFPDSIICGRARMMRKNIFGNWQNYENWKICTSEFKSKHLLPIGVAGVVYRKRLLDIDFLLNNDFMKIAPGTDDLWFKMASLRANNNVYVVPLIESNNMDINHKIGLGIKNNIKKKSLKTRILLFNKVWNRIANYLGVNQTTNDINWDSIIKINHQ